MGERSVYQVTNGPKSAPVGIDWLMIRAAKQSARQRKDSQKQARVDSSGEDNQKKQEPHTS